MPWGYKCTMKLPPTIDTLEILKIKFFVSFILSLALNKIRNDYCRYSWNVFNCEAFFIYSGYTIKGSFNIIKQCVVILTFTIHIFFSIHNGVKMILISSPLFFFVWHNTHNSLSWNLRKKIKRLWEELRSEWMRSIQKRLDTIEKKVFTILWSHRAWHNLWTNLINYYFSRKSLSIEVSLNIILDSDHRKQCPQLSNIISWLPLIEIQQFFFVKRKSKSKRNVKKFNSKVFRAIHSTVM